MNRGLKKKPFLSSTWTDVKEYVTKLEEESKELRKEVIELRMAEVIRDLPDSRDAIWSAVKLLARQDQPTCPLCNRTGEHEKTCLVPQCQAMINSHRKLKAWKR